MVAAPDGRLRPGTSHLERHQAFRGTDSKTARCYGVALTKGAAFDGESEKGEPGLRWSAKPGECAQRT
jgi:hypothetical protein